MEIVRYEVLVLTIISIHFEMRGLRCINGLKALYSANHFLPIPCHGYVLSVMLVDLTFLYSLIFCWNIQMPISVSQTSLEYYWTQIKLKDHLTLPHC